MCRRSRQWRSRQWPRLELLRPYLLVALTPVFVPSLVQGADVRAGRRITIPAEETIPTNLYVAAGEAEISGNIDGDLIVAGGEVSVQGAVENDIMAAGGQIDLMGYVGGDVRMAGGEIDIRGHIEGDLVVAGGTVQILPSGTIGGDVLMAGGELFLEGALERNLKAAGGTVTISGSIQGPVVVRSDQFTIGEQAKLEGSLDYFSPREIEFPESAQIAGPVNFHLTAGMNQRWIGDGLRRMGVALLFVGLMMSLAGGLFGCFVFPKTSTEVVRYTLGNFWKELLRGFVLFFVVPPAFFLLMLSVVGVPVAFLGGLIHLGFGVVAIIYAGVALGAFLMKRLTRAESYVADWKAVLVGLPIMFVVSRIPVIGFIANLMVFLAVLGGIYENFWLAIQRGRQKEAAV